MTILDTIRQEVEVELAHSEKNSPLAEVKRQAADAPPVRPFVAALRSGFGLIAEIKRRSPSAGDMRAENVQEAPAAYEASPLVKALSILTNELRFGMSTRELTRLRALTTKPVLRKDFIFTEYQIYQARACGADALLLMVNLVPDTAALRGLHQLAQHLGMEVLFEAHNVAEIQLIPAGAMVYGLNSRRFQASQLTVHLQTFDLVNQLPAAAIKLAESNIYPANIRAEVKDRGFNTALVGTSLLQNPAGVAQLLQQFEAALA